MKLQKYNRKNDESEQRIDDFDQDLFFASKA